MRRSSFYDPRRPIYTHPRFLPGSRLDDCAVRDAHRRRGLLPRPLRRSRSRSSASAPHVQPGATHPRSVLLGADFYEADDVAPARGDEPRLGIGRDVVLDRVIVDKNARIGDGARLVERRRRPGGRRRRLLHPRRDHRRAEGRRDRGRDAGLAGATFQLRHQPGHIKRDARVRDLAVVNFQHFTMRDRHT